MHAVTDEHEDPGGGIAVRSRHLGLRAAAVMPLLVPEIASMRMIVRAALRLSVVMIVIVIRACRAIVRVRVLP